MNRSRVLFLFSLAVVLALAAACGGPVPTPRPTVPFASSTPAFVVSPQPGETASPQPGETQQAQATATLQPSAAPTAGAPVTRIQFESGAIKALVDGHLAASEAAHYVLRAAAGQIMSVSLSPDQGQAILVIWGQDGDVLVSDHAGVAYWSGQLRTTQDYYIDVRSAADSTPVDYVLTVTIPPLPTPGAGVPPTRIQFAPGATSVTVPGTVPASSSKSYILRALAGQTMSVALTPASAPAYLVIWGEDGSVLLRGDWQAMEFSDELTLTQDYTIAVHSSDSSSAVSYTLKVTIPPLEDAGGDVPAMRIQFAPGATSAVVEDSVPPGGLDRYVLTVLAGQSMSVALTPMTGQAYIVVWGPNGEPMGAGQSEQAWSGEVPVTGDYTIDVVAFNASPTVHYGLSVVIPPLP